MALFVRAFYQVPTQVRSKRKAAEDCLPYLEGACGDRSELEQASAGSVIFPDLVTSMQVEADYRSLAE